MKMMRIVNQLYNVQFVASVQKLELSIVGTVFVIRVLVAFLMRHLHHPGVQNVEHLHFVPRAFILMLEHLAR